VIWAGEDFSGEPPAFRNRLYAVATARGKKVTVEGVDQDNPEEAIRDARARARRGEITEAEMDRRTTEAKAQWRQGLRFRFYDPR
jgi:hypothetical protein